MLADSLQLTISVYLNASVYCSGFPCQPCQLTQCNITLPYNVTPTYGPLLLGSLTGILTILQNQGLFLSLTLPTSSTGFDGCARSLHIGTSEIILQGSSEPLTLSDPPSAVPGCPRETHCMPHPCANGACQSYWSGYSCMCPLDYVGQNCSECEPPRALQPVHMTVLV